MKKIISILVMACMLTGCAGLKPDEMVKTGIQDNAVSTGTDISEGWENQEEGVSQQDENEKQSGSQQSFISRHWFAAAVSVVCIASLAFNCWQYRERSKTQIQTGQPATGIEGQAQEIARLTAAHAEVTREKEQLIQDKEQLTASNTSQTREIARLTADYTRLTALYTEQTEERTQLQETIRQVKATKHIDFLIEADELRKISLAFGEVPEAGAGSLSERAKRMVRLAKDLQRENRELKSGERGPYLQEQLEVLQRENPEVQERLALFQNQLDTLQRENEALAKQISYFDSERLEVLGELDKVRKLEQGTLKERVIALRKKYDTEKSWLKTDRENFEKILKEEREKIKLLEFHLDQIRTYGPQRAAEIMEQIAAPAAGSTE